MKRPAPRPPSTTCCATDMDALPLAQALIRRPSVTPVDAGALDVLEAVLKELGFVTHRLPFGDVDNLYARLGTEAPHFCFAGHTDVVPVGEGWKEDPSAAQVRDGLLFGRGAADMKSAIAAFVAAVARHRHPKGSISLLITGDEEGAAVNGTVKLLEWLKARGEKIDHCVVGEPTSVSTTGDTLKIGRRGSNNFPLVDKGTEPFDPSTLAFTTIDVGNAATNVIPGEARAGFNIRFNDKHTPDSLTNWIKDRTAQIAQQSGCEIAVTGKTSGVAFLTAPGKFTQLVSDTVAGVTGQAPFFSTSGGTSDARFIKEMCPVVELGLAGATMHKADECVPVSEIAALTDIYAALLTAYFKKPPV